jgi:hypothetical protein
LATAWQAMQFFALARSAFAIADCVAKAEMATIPTIRILFIVFSIETPIILPLSYNVSMITKVDVVKNLADGIALSFVR